MLIGSGMLAKVFSAYSEREDVVILAAGVSNSMEIQPEAFEREINLVKKIICSIGDRQLVYFSTCSVYDSAVAKTPYVRHKLNIEKMISEMASNYSLFRLPQVVGKSANSKTLISFLHNRIINNQPIDVWTGAYRYIIDVDDIASIVSFAIDNKFFLNSTINVASNPVLVIKLIEILEGITGKKANCSLCKKGGFYRIDTTSIKPILEELGIEFGPTYALSTLSKYYSADALS